jgi:S1-C subfamily serine protease
MQLLKLLILLLMIPGCASPSLTLINERGDTVRCAASGSFQGAFIASSMVSSCLNDYQKFGFILSPQIFLGIRLSDWRYSPVMVTEVAPSSPASVGKISKGDRIVELDGIPISAGWDVVKILALKKQNDMMQVVTERDGLLSKKTIHLSQRSTQ